MVVGVLLVGGAAVACSDSPTTGSDVAVVTAVTPTGGAVGVQRDTPIEIDFSRTMLDGVEADAAVHLGGVTGPEVNGTWTWMDDHMRLRFTPDAPLDSATMYTIHLGGGMMDADGNAMNYDSCLSAYGGDWVTSEMLSGGTMGSGDMMGPGWRNANGMYGVMFTFQTR